jgi:PmbA protein
MDQRVIEALQRQPGVDDWTVRFRRARGIQIYLVGGVVESTREVARDSYEIETFNDHLADGEPVRGSATIPLAREDLDGLPTLLDRAVTMATLVHNLPWDLPAPAACPEVLLADEALLDPAGMRQAADGVAELVRGAVDQERGAGVRLSAAELFLHRYDDELRSSRGIDESATGTHALMELALLATGDGEEAEYFSQAQARRLDDLAVEATVSHGAQMARDKVRAVAPTTRRGPVVIVDQALDQLFGESVIGSTGALLNQASASSAYAKISRFELGSPIYGGIEVIGDPLTLHANATRPHAVPSYRFDADGVPAQDLLVVADGVLVARPATRRYAAYLGIPTTGRPGIAEIAPGSTAAADLLGGDGPLYRIAAFSAANVDALSGNFGMEVRLGYEVGPGGERPITGGSLTGNLFEALAAARMARETRQLASYAGPVAIRFEVLQVSGE